MVVLRENMLYTKTISKMNFYLFYDFATSLLLQLNAKIRLYSTYNLHIIVFA